MMDRNGTIRRWRTRRRQLRAATKVPPHEVVNAARVHVTRRTCLAAGERGDLLGKNRSQRSSGHDRASDVRSRVAAAYDADDRCRTQWGLARGAWASFLSPGVSCLGADRAAAGCGAVENFSSDVLHHRDGPL